MSTLDKAIKAKAVADKLLQEARNEQLVIIENAKKVLRQLGYDADRNAQPGRSPRTRATRSTDPAGRHCPYCDVAGHDGRAHRGQVKKRKFTPAELEALGL